MPQEIIISSDSHVFEPPDLWTTRIDAKFRDRAPYMKRVGNEDHLIVEGDQKISGIGQISGAGLRFESPEKILPEAQFEEVHVGGYDPSVHIKDMQIDGISGQILYPSQGLFYFAVKDSELTSAIFRTYNDWLAEFCNTYPDRLKGVAMINLDDVRDGIGELIRTANMGLEGAMISESPGTDRRYDSPEYEPFWAVAQDAGIPISLHTATARHGETRTTSKRGLRQAATRVNKIFWVGSSLCDIIFSGVFERFPRLKVAVVEFELAWVPHFLRSLDYTYIERQFEADYRFKGDILPSDFFHSNIYLSFQEDDIGIRLRDVIGVDSLMWGSDYPHAESTFPRSQEILNDILKGVPQEERAKIVCGNVAQLYNFNLTQLIHTET